MQLIATDILTEGRGLTGAMLGTVCVLGAALWVFGWRWHRFWVVAGMTLGAGLIGLNAGRTGGTQVLAVGILLAVGAGMMALELAKVFAFVAGGVGAWLVVQWVLPQAQELWAVFLSGGLFGLLLYRLWTMLLTSLMGVLLAGHAGLLLVERAFGFDAVAWAEANIVALNGVTVALVVLGILLQARWAREPEEKPAEPEEAKPEDEPEEEEHEPAKEHADPVAEAIEHLLKHDKPEKHESPKAAHKADPGWWKKLLGHKKAG